MHHNTNASNAAVMPRPQTLLSWLLRIAVAALFLVTAVTKLLWAPETQAIFDQIGGRPAATAIAFIEVAAALLLLLPKTVHFGAVIAAGIMVGAIASHIAVLGIAVDTPDAGNDGGAMFAMAVAALIASLGVAFLHRAEIRRLMGGPAADDGARAPHS